MASPLSPTAGGTGFTTMSPSINPVPAFDDRNRNGNAASGRAAGESSLHAGLLGAGGAPRGQGSDTTFSQPQISPTTSQLSLYDLGVHDEDEQFVRERYLPMVYCLMACAFGLVGFSLTLYSANKDLCPENYPNELTSKSLTRWPSTVSELNSDWSTGRGRLFFSFMLVTSVMLLAAKVPYTLEGHDVSNQHNVDVGKVCCFGCWVKTGTFKLGRVFVVPLGLMFVAFCPTQNYWSNHQPGEAVVKSVHLASAGLLFVVGSLIEIHRAAHLLIFFERTAATTASRPDPQGPCSRCCQISWTMLKDDRRGARAVIAWILVVGLLTIIPSFWKTHHDEMTMASTKGDILFSPAGTDYCPGPVYKFADMAENSLQTYARLTETPRSMRNAVYDQLTCQKSCAGKNQGIKDHSSNVNAQLKCHATCGIQPVQDASTRIFADTNNRSAGCFISSTYLESGSFQVDFKTRQNNILQNAAELKDEILKKGFWNASKLNLSCIKTRVLPKFIALCVCAEPDFEASALGERVCTWTNPGNAEDRIRLFMQEVFLAIALLANFAIIALEFQEATPRRQAPQAQPMQVAFFCCKCDLHAPRGQYAAGIGEMQLQVWQKLLRYVLPCLMVFIMMPVLPVWMWTESCITLHDFSFNIETSVSLPMALIVLIFRVEPRLRRMCIILAYTVALAAAFHWYIYMSKDDGAWYSWIPGIPKTKHRPYDATIWFQAVLQTTLPAIVACRQIYRFSVDAADEDRTQDHRLTWGATVDRGRGNGDGSIYD